MRKKIRMIVVGIMGVMVGMLLAILIYNVFIFQQYYPDIQSYIQSAHPLEKSPPQALMNAALLVEGKNGIRNMISRKLLFQFGRNTQRMLTWHVEYALWSLLVGLYVPDNEEMTLWCSFLPYKHGMGINNSANFYYGRNIDQLRIEELMTLIVRSKAPFYFTQYPDELKKVTQKFLDRYISRYANRE